MIVNNIKRYQNGKLFSITDYCYVSLNDIVKMVRNAEEVVIIDNKTKEDITSEIFSEIIFREEKRSKQFPPIKLQRRFICNINIYK